MFQSIILQSMLGVLLVAAALPVIHSGIQPGGWLSNIGNWFSNSFSGQQRAEAPGTPGPVVAQAPQTPVQQQAEITPPPATPGNRPDVGRQV